MLPDLASLFTDAPQSQAPGGSQLRIDVLVKLAQGQLNFIVSA